MADVVDWLRLFLLKVLFGLVCLLKTSSDAVMLL